MDGPGCNETRDEGRCIALVSYYVFEFVTLFVRLFLLFHSGYCKLLFAGTIFCFNVWLSEYYIVLLILCAVFIL